MRQIKNFMEAKRPMWNCNECKCITMQCWKESEAFCGCGGSSDSPIINFNMDRQGLYFTLPWIKSTLTLLGGHEDTIWVIWDVNGETKTFIVFVPLTSMPYIEEDALINNEEEKYQQMYNLLQRAVEAYQQWKTSISSTEEEGRIIRDMVMDSANTFVNIYNPWVEGQDLIVQDINWKQLGTIWENRINWHSVRYIWYFGDDIENALSAGEWETVGLWYHVSQQIRKWLEIKDAVDFEYSEDEDGEHFVVNVSEREIYDFITSDGIWEGAEIRVWHKQIWWDDNDHPRLEEYLKWTPTYDMLKDLPEDALYDVWFYIPQGRHNKVVSQMKSWFQFIPIAEDIWQCILYTNQKDRIEVLVSIEIDTEDPQVVVSEARYNWEPEYDDDVAARFRELMESLDPECVEIITWLSSNHWLYINTSIDSSWTEEVLDEQFAKLRNCLEEVVCVQEDWSEWFIGEPSYWNKLYWALYANMILRCNDEYSWDYRPRDEVPDKLNWYNYVDPYNPNYAYDREDWDTITFEATSENSANVHLYVAWGEYETTVSIETDTEDPQVVVGECTSSKEIEACIEIREALTNSGAEYIANCVRRAQPYSSYDWHYEQTIDWHKYIFEATSENSANVYVDMDWEIYATTVTLETDMEETEIVVWECNIAHWFWAASEIVDGVRGSLESMEAECMEKIIWESE